MIDTTILKAAWNKQTSANPEQWSKTNPARGQCAVTALVIQDFIGGILVRTMATLPDGTEESHYAQMDEETGTILDATEQQFPKGTVFGPWEERSREYVLGFQPTVERYNLLCQRVAEALVLKRVQAVHDGVQAELDGEDEEPV